MPALVAAADRGNVADVRRLLREGASLDESDVNGRTAMYMAVDGRHNLVVKCLIKEGGADIEAKSIVIVGHHEFISTVLGQAARNGNFPLVQWLIEEGALIPTTIWKYLRVTNHLQFADAKELSSLLKVLTLLPMSPDHDRGLPAFVGKLSPQHAELCTRGRLLRDLLPAYLEQQEASVGKDCPLPAVLRAMVTAYAYALPTPEDLWSDGLRWL
jgi:hypothetical protein